MPAADMYTVAREDSIVQPVLPRVPSPGKIASPNPYPLDGMDGIAQPEIENGINQPALPQPEVETWYCLTTTKEGALLHKTRYRQQRYIIELFK